MEVKDRMTNHSFWNFPYLNTQRNIKSMEDTIVVVGMESVSVLCDCNMSETLSDWTVSNTQAVTRVLRNVCNIHLLLCSLLSVYITYTEETRERTG